MITGSDIWQQYVDELQDLFRELIHAKGQDDEAATVEVLMAVNLLAESYIEKSEMVRALDEKHYFVEIGRRVDN